MKGKGEEDLYKLFTPSNILDYSLRFNPLIRVIYKNCVT